MSTTEEYLDQLLKNMTSGGSLFDEQNEMAESRETEDGLTLEQAMDMSVEDVLSEIDTIEEMETGVKSQLEQSGEKVVGNKTQPELVIEMEVGAKSEKETEKETKEPEEIIKASELSETSINNGMMSADEIEALFATGVSTEIEQISEGVEKKMAEEPKLSEQNSSNGMMSADEIAALFAASESTETEQVSEVSEESEKEIAEEEELAAPSNSNGMMSADEIAALFAASESTETEQISEVGEESEKEIAEEEELAAPSNSNGMMSADEIAALFAASESAETDLVTEVSEEPEKEIAADTEAPASDAEVDISKLLGESDIQKNDTGESEVISLDDMLADIGGGKEIMSEESLDSLGMNMGEGTGNESDDILDLLNMMSEDEDLKDIGDLLKEDDTGLELSDAELFGDSFFEEKEEAQPESEGNEEEKLGFFASLFGKKKKSKTQGAEGDENQQIIKEVEEEIKEEEEKKAKKKQKKEKKKKNSKKKGEGEEGAEEEGKEKKVKKKKVKKEKPPKEIVPEKKEPPLPKKPVILILLMAASIVGLVLVSDKVINYQINISKADNSFINNNYEEAYQNILGVEVKEEDQEIYDKIRIMMKLESKYQMYLAHIESQQYDDALNDLIMGVVKYDKYAKEADELGIAKTFEDEYIRMEEQLNMVYGVDADQAREWYYSLSALDYTEMVKNVVKAAGYTIEDEIPEDETDLSQFGVEAVE